MQIAFLGTGNAFVPQRASSCLLINETILLDAGPAVLLNLKRLPVDPARIRHIFISHFHGDHFFGLPFLLLDSLFVSRTTAPLAIIGPPGIEARTQAVMDLAFPDVKALGWPRPLQFIEAQPDVTDTVDDITFTPLRMAHADGTLIAYGYRLHLPDGVLAYSGDTRMTDTLYPLIDGARAIVLEASEAEESAYHLGQAALRTLLAAVPPTATVFLTHLESPGAGPWRDWPVIIPEDLQRFTLECAPLHPVRG